MSSAFEEQKLKLAQLVKLGISYFETLFEYTKLSIAEQATAFITLAVKFVLIVIFSSFIVLFSGIALAIYIGSWINSLAVGFLIIAFFFLILLFLSIFVAKKLLEKKLADSIINTIHNDKYKQPFPTGNDADSN